MIAKSDLPSAKERIISKTLRNAKITIAANFVWEENLKENLQHVRVKKKMGVKQIGNKTFFLTSWEELYKILNGDDNQDGMRDICWVFTGIKAKSQLQVSICAW